jgi:hypothetical protein
VTRSKSSEALQREHQTLLRLFQKHSKPASELSLHSESSGSWERPYPVIHGQLEEMGDDCRRPSGVRNTGRSSRASRLRRDSDTTALLITGVVIPFRALMSLLCACEAPMRVPARAHGLAGNLVTTEADGPLHRRYEPIEACKSNPHGLKRLIDRTVRGHWSTGICTMFVQPCEHLSAVHILG